MSLASTRNTTFAHRRRPLCDVSFLSADRPTQRGFHAIIPTASAVSRRREGRPQARECVFCAEQVTSRQSLFGRLSLDEVEQGPARTLSPRPLPEGVGGRRIYGRLSAGRHSRDPLLHRGRSAKTSEGLNCASFTEKGPAGWMPLLALSSLSPRTRPIGCHRRPLSNPQSLKRAFLKGRPLRGVNSIYCGR